MAKKIDVGQTRARDFCRTSDPGWQLKIRNCHVEKWMAFSAPVVPVTTLSSEQPAAEE